MLTLESLAVFVAHSIRPLEEDLGKSDQEIIDFVMQLGWVLPVVPDALRGLQDASSQVIDALLDFEEKRWSQFQGGENSEEISDAANTLYGEVALLGAMFQTLPNYLRSQLPSSYLGETSIATEFVPRLFDWLAIQFLREQYFTAYCCFVLLGWIEVKLETENPLKHQPAFEKYIIHWEHISLLIKDPSQLFEKVYGWGTPTIDGDRLFDALLDLSFALGIPAEMHYPLEAFIQALAPGGIVSEQTGPNPQLWFPLIWTETLGVFLVTYVLPKATPSELQGLATTLVFSGNITETIPLANGLSLSFEGATTSGSGAALVIRPDRQPAVFFDAFESAQMFTGGRIDARLRFVIENGQQLLSDGSGTSLEANEIHIAGITSAMANGTVEASVEAGIVEGKLIIDGAGADGFLKKILPSEPLQIEFDVIFGISSKRGFYITGGAGLEYTFIINKSFGPIFVYSIKLKLEANDKHLALINTVTGGAEIGPVTAVIDFGMKTSLEFGKPGLLGNNDLALGFQPPTVIGLSVDAQGITGGGFLKIDPPNYAGMLQLSYRNEIELTAFALLTTKLPDGTDGFSLVIQIMAEFQPIQIGLGFALTGVGGLIGINRQMSEEGLKAAFKTHSLDAILFPKNPIKDAVKIIETIQSVLPPREGYHVFGPMVQLYWGGSVRLVEFEVGIFVQIGGPLRVLILGQARSRLPNAEFPRLVINLDVLGIIDFGEDSLAIDAVLFDSKLLSYALDGKMALRADWTSGEENFALSIGGFHPQFHNIPPGFPQLTRLIITIGSGNPRLTLQMYLAITPNTLQVGARFELWVKKLGFTITGGASFNALFTFSPFSFLVTVEVWVNIKRGFVDLGAWLSFELSGPNPLIAAGYVKFKVGPFSKKVRFRKQFGDEKPEPLPVVSPLTALGEALKHPGTLRSQLPSWASANLIFVEDAESKIDPVADIIILQHAVPLNLDLEKFGGGRPPEAEKRLAITAGLDPQEEIPTQTLFAPEQFKNWSDDVRLSAKPFENYDAGIRFSGDYVIPTDALEERPVEYETVLRESRAYRDKLQDGNYLKAAVRTTCIWQLTASEANFLKDWSLLGAKSYFKPLRRMIDEGRPGYIKVREARFNLFSDDTVNGELSPLEIENKQVRNNGLSYAEALEASENFGDSTTIMLNTTDMISG